MSPVPVVVADVFVHEAFHVPLIENDHMIEQVTTAVADPALGHGILSRAAVAGPLGLNAKALYDINDFSIEIAATVKDQVARSGVVREGLTQLLHNPGAGRMLGHIEVQDAPPVMGNDKEAIELAEGKRRHGEEVHRGDRLTMITQKRRPSFCRLGDSSARFASIAARSVQKYRSPAFSTRLGFAVLPKSCSRRPCGR